LCCLHVRGWEAIILRQVCHIDLACCKKNCRQDMARMCSTRCTLSLICQLRTPPIKCYVATSADATAALAPFWRL
jgi:hypothetical protein